MKCECGLNYVPGQPEDEKQHSHIHLEYLAGPEIPAVQQLSHIATVGSLAIYVVDGACPMALRRELSRVAMVAHRSMPAYPAGYDGTITDDDQRLYIVADGVHIVAMALTVLDNIFWRLGWDVDCSVKLMDQVPLENRGYMVARVWTAGAYRRKGLASQLLQVVSEMLPCNIVDLGWELPFTMGGAHLVKRLCPDLFWGCGDSFSLRKAMEKTSV